MITYNDLLKENAALKSFVEMIARLKTETESVDDEGYPGMSGDDAVDALCELISTARSLL